MSELLVTGAAIFAIGNLTGAALMYWHRTGHNPISFNRHSLVETIDLEGEPIPQERLENI